MGDRPAQRDIDKHLAIIAKLRELDTDQQYRTICDQDELEWRRLAMDGYPQCEGGGITIPAHSRSLIELLQLDPQAYFDTINPYRPAPPGGRLPRPRGHVPTTDKERQQAWDDAYAQAEKDLPTLRERWRRRGKKA